MIVTEFIDERLRKTYSDRNMQIRKLGTNEVYAIAVDLRESQAMYEETDEPIPKNNDKGGDNNETSTN